MPAVADAAAAAEPAGDASMYDADHELVREVVAHLAHSQPWLGDSRRVVQEMLRCLKCYADAEHPEMYSMPAVLDEAWHAFILNTRDYIAYCYAHFGRVIHHSTATSRDTEEEKEERRANLRGAYAGTHGRAPPEDVWGGAGSMALALPAKRQRTESQEEAPEVRMRLTFRDQSGRSINFNVRPTTRFEVMMKKYCEHFDVELKEAAFRFEGSRLMPDGTPREMDMEDGEQVYVIIKQAGC
ncbi:unnamed protein product [Pedinophyceae sp. YPF-701]|nr:unnamed protein product [Pedinophyceae sp. YPF-701]